MIIDFNLNTKPTYQELKEWFLSNIDNLPNTLDGGYKYYYDVKGTCQTWINQIDSEIEVHKDEIKRSALARSGISNLKMLYEELQKIEDWNKERHKINW